MNFIIRRAVPLGACALLAFPMIASAHPFHGQSNQVTTAFLHPLAGWDHLVALASIAFWAVHFHPGSALRFLSVILGASWLGGLFSTSGWILPGYDGAILASVAIPGLTLLLNKKPGFAFSVAAVAAFGFLNGTAHGAELSGSPASFAGWLAGTAAAFGLGFLAVRLAPRVAAGSAMITLVTLACLVRFS